MRIAHRDCGHPLVALNVDLVPRQSCHQPRPEYARLQDRLAHVNGRYRDALARVEPERDGFDSAMGLNQSGFLRGIPRSHASRATQRMPLPHISDSLPSALNMPMRALATEEER